MPTAYAHAFRHALSTGCQQWIHPYVPPTRDDRHQFVLFLKPEVTALEKGVDIEGVLALVLEALERFEVSVHASRALPAGYLSAHAVMSAHYGVIHAISREGEAALTETARARLHSEFAEDLREGARILGGHQFLAECPEFSPLSLSVLSDLVGTTKLGGGSYCLRARICGRPFLLLNPFHPWQLVPYTTPGHAILVLECRSTASWRDLRGRLTGSTDPLKAAPGSLRAELLSRKEALGLPEVNQGNNGVHLSAGPLEGMVELRRFFSDPEGGSVLRWEDTTFGRALLTAGLDPERLSGNPGVPRGQSLVSAFDLTEEQDASAAIGMLS